MSRASESMYHALGYGTIMFLQAVMTFDKVQTKQYIFRFIRLFSHYKHEAHISHFISIVMFMIVKRRVPDASKIWSESLLCIENAWKAIKLQILPHQISVIRTTVHPLTNYAQFLSYLKDAVIGG